MRIRIPNGVMRPFLIVVMAAGVMGGGCALDKVDEPQLSGPSETGISVQLTALPDTLNADGGGSRASVQLVLRDEQGRPVVGRAVLFCKVDTAPSTVDTCVTTANGEIKPSTPGTSVGPIQTGIVMATDSNGVATVVWISGTATETITLAARSYGIDAARGFLRTVQIFQQ